MSESKPTISVALVTRNRPSSFTRCLQSLRAQSVQPFEVVVSDDSDDALAPEVRQVAERFHCRYLRGPRKGLYANRNHVATACRGTHMRTMDDDHEFPAQHFARVEASLLEHPADLLVISERYPEDGCRREFPPGQLGPNGYGHPLVDPEHGWAVADGSTVYPAPIFQNGGRFIEEWRFGQSYLEFGARLHFEHGVNSRLVPGTYVIHHQEQGLRGPQIGLEEAASAVYAGLAYSWWYRPSLAHRCHTLARSLELLLRHRGAGWRALRWGAGHFLKQNALRKALRKQPAPLPSALAGIVG